MKTILSSRLILKPFTLMDFEIFVSEMLIDPKVVEFFYSYKYINQISIREKALSDFWEHFEQSRNEYGLEIWAARILNDPGVFIGWCGLLHTELSDKYQYPELQFMISGNAQGKGYATEIAKAILKYATNHLDLKSIIATVDIPNISSIKVLEKLGFQRIEQIEVYGSKDMYLFQINLD